MLPNTKEQSTTMKKSSRSGSVGTYTNNINKSHSHSTKENQDQDINSVFRRTEVVGRGKFGVVYKGYNIKTKHIYAIKVLNLDSDADEVEDVQREVQFLSSLKQIPNITRYYGSYLKNTSLWIIMEYCAGGSLRSLLRPGKIDEKYIGVIMKEVLIALKYIHRENIIHRDIKAANILITNEGSIKLCDFGVAAQLNQATLRRQTMAGTPYWMAPEVIMEGVSYDTKVDIWSLGITAYEIATGNPPYCEVEALRAMQLITKSKPPRLEGRSYSAPLKEFIALCLDEDPNERLEAEELLNCKFIKLHKNLPTSILKELVTRYLLFRDKNKRDSHLQGDEVKIENAKHTNNEVDNNQDNKDDINHDNKENDDSMNDSSQDIDNIAMKWDFDSLSSTDYIIENNINIDAISEDQTDWPQEQVNYAYPDEDPYYYYHTNNNNNMATNINKNFYQGTTMGKNNPNTIYHNSTFNAPMSHMNTTTNFQSKMMLGTSTQATSNLKSVTGTYNTNMGTGRKAEAKAPKQLLELFEDTDAITEVEEPNDDTRRMNKMMSTAHLDTLNKNMGTPSGIDNKNVNGGTPTSTSFTINNPHNNLVNSQSYFAQSAPQLPHLQTKFTKSSNDSSNTLMTAPTSIEIEIPEELPTSALPTPLPTEHPSHLQTKPRSSTVSISPLAYQHQHQQASSTSSQEIKQVQQPQPHGLIRRSTVGGNNSIRSSENDSVEKNKVVNKTIAEEISRSASFINVPGTSTDTPNRIKASEISKIHRRTPSPAKAINGMIISPVKKSALSPTGIKNSTPTASVSTGNIPTMKPMMGLNDNKDVLLHPLNASSLGHITTNTSSNNNNNNNSNGSNNNGESTVPIPLPIKTSNVIEKEPSRVNSEFKRNNPNLKLQMPLPTTMTRNKLLDANGNVINPSSGPIASSSQGNNSSITNENINQFGFNTSASQNVPVSMTPISEKHMDFSSKIKRSHSVTNRKNSLSNDTLNPSQHPPPSHSVLNALVSPVGGGVGGTSGSSGTIQTSNSSVPIYNAQTAATNLAQSSGNPVNSQLSNSGNLTTESSGTSTAMSSGHSTALSVKSGNGVSGGISNVSSNAAAVATATAAAATTTTVGPVPSNTTTDIVTPASSTTSTSHGNSNSKPNTLVMAPPPSMLRMSLFQDVEQDGTHRRVDRKPEVLHELDMLLHLFEENLPAMENALKQQLNMPITTPSSGNEPVTPAATTTTTTTITAVPPNPINNQINNPISNQIQQPVATTTDSRG